LASDESGGRAAHEVRGYRIEGRVQGVGFRWWTENTAASLGLSGSVWNRTDGSVEVCAAGTAAALDALEHALDEGPLGARVDSVTRVEPDHTPSPGQFRIEHRS
jgi:acylphosphatase